MSLDLLESLNGSQRGAFHQFLSTRDRPPRISWYPSAGEDFRDILYLSSAYAASTDSPVPAPDIYLHSDYFPWTGSRFLDRLSMHDDGRTAIDVSVIEELPRLDLPLDERIVDFPKGSIATGRVIYLELRVRSTELGKYPARCLYVFAENEAFCGKMILPNKGMLSHVIHVRYGGGAGGGGKASGIWLKNVLGRLGCEFFLTDDHAQLQSGDAAALEIYPALCPHGPEPSLTPIRVTPSDSWSRHGDVTWYAVGPKSAVS
ncbi:MAG: hypothetical protein EP329_18590 [Deltaproteobacteria bacterium]|nr:MAG: hypothetical protein EP329_18590 [Deltaproteobacteria bacterium]